MSVPRTLRIGARRSPLSRVQTEHVGAALQALDPGLRLGTGSSKRRRSPDRARRA
ncbi:MAG: hypothetical protein R3E65_11650 [Steroidobacteraceae bacterium]